MPAAPRRLGSQSLGMEFLLGLRFLSSCQSLSYFLAVQKHYRESNRLDCDRRIAWALFARGTDAGCAESLSESSGLFGLSFSCHFCVDASGRNFNLASNLFPALSRGQSPIPQDAICMSIRCDHERRPVCVV